MEVVVEVMLDSAEHLSIVSTLPLLAEMLFDLWCFYDREALARVWGSAHPLHGFARCGVQPRRL
jgi:hypothetical protein